MTADPIAVVVDFLRENAEVAAASAGRVYGWELPAAQAASMPRRAVTITGSGGTSGGAYNPIQFPRVDVRTYGESMADAMALRGVVHEALKYATRTGLLISAVEQSGPIQLEDPETRWPFVLSVWGITAYEEALHA